MAAKQLRNDIRLGTLEDRYHVLFNHRRDMRAGTLKKKWRVRSVSELIQNAGENIRGGEGPVRAGNRVRGFSPELRERRQPL